MSFDWGIAGKIGLTLGGYALLGPLGGIAGSYLGSIIFPTEYESEMPTVHDMPIQSSAVGIPIPIVFGTARIAGNIIWMGKLDSYEVEHSSGGGKGGGSEQPSYEIKYKRSFLIAICEGPASILRAWKGKEVMPTSEFTTYTGDNNSGLSIEMDKPYAEYSNLCLAYFEDYELGNSQAMPNFIFEVAAGVLGDKTLFVGGTVDDGKHLWEISDNGTELTLLNSYTLPGNVKSMRYSPYNDRLYICIDDSVYCYDPDTMELDEDWGSSGRVNLDSVYRLKVDDEGYAIVVTYRTAPTKRLALLDESGEIVWEIAASADPYEADFDKDGNIIVTHHGTSGGRVDRFSRVDGSFIERIRDTAVLPGYWSRCMVADKTERDWCWFDLGYTSGTLNGYHKPIGGSWSSQWSYSVGSNSGYKDSKHIPKLDKLVSSIGNVLTIMDCYTGNNVVKSSTSGTNVIDISSNNEIYTGGNAGLVKVYNTSMSIVRSLDVGDSNLAGCALREIISPNQAFDMNFAYMIKDLLTKENYGGYDESDLITEDFSSIISYCDANDLKGSFAITQQKPLPDWIAYICSHFQGYFYEIGGKIGLNCYRSQDSVLSISQDDLIRDGDEPPVHTTKRAYSSTFNRLEASWSDRDNDYKTAVVPAFDRIDQRESGQVRTKVFDLKGICDKDLATKMAWRIFIDQIYRFSQYSFKLGYKSMLLEVGDVIDVTDGHLLVAKKMRVMSVSEEKDGRRAVITAVEDIADFYPTLAYTTQQSEATGDDDIVLTDGIISFRESHLINKLYLSITPGGTQCNGFYIYKSYDDESYELIGKSAIGGITGGEANSVGTIQSNLPAYPAVVHRKDEAFNVSIGTLTDLDTSISDDDFFNNRKLARVGTEIIGYRDCVESATTGIWRISNLIRGLFGTEAVSHSPGEVFNTLHTNFAYILNNDDIGKTLYFKVVSYYMEKVQSITEVSAYSYVVSGKYAKPLSVSLIRINGREGLSTYKTSDVTLDWYFCSKGSGFGRGGYGNVLWGAYTKDLLVERLKVEVEEEDETAIIDEFYNLEDYVEAVQLEILEADRDGKNPVRVKITPGSNLWSDKTRSILIEKI